MNKNLKSAIGIAESYSATHDGQIPVLVVAHGDKETFTLVGSFREKHKEKDQQTFCSVLRLAFAIHGVTSYEIICKPLINTAELQMTQNVLAIMQVGQNTQKVEFFEIDGHTLIPYFKNLKVEGMFTQLLPTEMERNGINFSETKFIDGINNYINNVRYTAPEVIETAEERTANSLDALKSAFA